MRNYDKLYLNGAWTPSTGTSLIDVVDASTEAVLARVPEGTAADIDRAVAAARDAFEPWSQLSVEQRAGYLARIAEGLGKRSEELAEVISREVGMPLALSKLIQAGLPTANFGTFAALVRQYTFEEQVGNSLVLREPVGVVGCITPWNYPLH